MRNRIILLIIGISSLAGAQTSSRLGGLPGSPLRMGFGPEGISFGNAQVAVRTNPVTGYYNPALLPFREFPVGMLSVGFLSLDRNLNFLSYSRPVQPSGGISIGIINSGVSDIEGRDSDGRHIETLSTSENAFLLSFGVKVDEHLSIGISTKILYYHLYSDVNSTTVGFDLGILGIISDEWTIGASLQDLGSKYKWDTTVLYGTGGNTTVDRFPLRKKIGVAYESSSIPLIASLEAEHVGKFFFVRAGSSFQLVEQFVLRAGIDQLSFSNEILPKPAFGLALLTGMKSLMTTLSYTFVVEPYSPAGIHILAVGVEFR